MLDSLQKLIHGFIKPATDNLVEVVRVGTLSRSSVEMPLKDIVNLRRDEILGRELAKEFPGNSNIPLHCY